MSTISNCERVITLVSSASCFRYMRPASGVINDTNNNSLYNACSHARRTSSRSLSVAVVHNDDASTSGFTATTRGATGAAALVMDASRRVGDELGATATGTAASDTALAGVVIAMDGVATLAGVDAAPADDDDAPVTGVGLVRTGVATTLVRDVLGDDANGAASTLAGDDDGSESDLRFLLGAAYEQ